MKDQITLKQDEFIKRATLGVLIGEYDRIFIAGLRHRCTTRHYDYLAKIDTKLQEHGCTEHLNRLEQRMGV